MEANKIIFKASEHPQNIYWINHYGTIVIYKIDNDDVKFFEANANFDEWGSLDNVEIASAQECKQLIYELKKEVEE